MMNYEEKIKTYDKITKILEIVLSHFNLEYLESWVLTYLWKNEELLEKLRGVLLEKD